MSLQLAKSKTAGEAYHMIKDLQARLVHRLDALPPSHGSSRFRSVEWLRSGGACGGGVRYEATDELLFNRASVNISQVQYEQDPLKTLASASAISTIVHPRSPFAPSMHMHISWTEMKSGQGYWRIMGDLNPSLPAPRDTEAFAACFREVAGPQLYQQASEQGNKYFYIPALGRHRGVIHFYLEDFSTKDHRSDLQYAEAFGSKLIDTYGSIVTRILEERTPIEAEHWRQQLDYHTLYFLQVLTLDRGTTSGLLVHDENDAGILGSLPAHVDKQLLQSWLPKLPELQQLLLRDLLLVLADGETSLVDEPTKIKVAQVCRNFYRQHPAAQELLARGNVLPPTQQNHSPQKQS